MPIGVSRTTRFNRPILHGLAIWLARGQAGLAQLRSPAPGPNGRHV